MLGSTWVPVRFKDDLKIHQWLDVFEEWRMIGLHWKLFSELWSRAKRQYNLNISLWWLDIRQMQRCWRGYLGRLRWDSDREMSVYFGEVSRAQHKSNNHGEYRWGSLVLVYLTCTHHQSQFWIELSCSSALSIFQWPLPSHETGWQIYWLKWTGC